MRMRVVATTTGHEEGGVGGRIGFNVPLQGPRTSSGIVGGRLFYYEPIV